MSPHQKARGRGWKKCAICGCIFITQDEGIHRDVCNIMIENDRFIQNFLTTDQFVKHSFIKNSRFFGSCTKNTSDRLLGDIKVNAKCDDEIVTLPLIVMKFCSICIGGLVMLTNSAGVQIVRTAAPNEHLRNDIGLKEKTFEHLDLKARDYISIEAYKGSRIPAEEIVLIPKHEENDLHMTPTISSGIVKALKKRENNKYLSISNKLSLRYMGSAFEFSVGKIGLTFKNKKEPLSLNLNRKLNNSEHTSWTTSTPIKSSVPSNATTNNREFYQVTSGTEINIQSPNNSSSEKQTWSYSKIGGLDEEISFIQKLIDQSKSKNTPMGILISGPSGIGKSALVQAVAAENKSHIFLSVNKPNEILKTQSEIQRVFEDARKKSPSILLIEDIEDWCPKRSDVINIQHIQLASTLMFEINQIHLDDLAIIIIATTRDANDLDQTLRRPSYFDFEIKLDIPTVVQKTDTLKKILLVFHHTLTHAEMFELAKLTYGYTGSTLKRLVDKVSLEKLRSSADASVAVELHFEDLKCIMKDIVPEVMDGLNYNIPEVHWTDIAGYDNVKKKLIHCIIWPLKYPDRFKHLGVSLSKGILLYGPSGCGKSMLVEAIATASKYNFMYVTSNDVSIKYVGKSEEAIKNLFLAAKRAAPCIIFFDKIESLGSSRGGLGTGGRVENRVLGQLLKAIEEVRLEMVFVIGATTLPHLVDEALLRPGRFDLKNHVALPDSETRRQMFKICLKKMQVTDDVVDEELIRRTEGYSGADIKGLCCSAMCKALHEQQLYDPTQLRLQLTLVLQNSTPSCSDYEIERCELFQQKKIK